MKNENVNEIWRAGEAPDNSGPEKSLSYSINKFSRGIRRRDQREIYAALFVIAAFSVTGLLIPFFWSKVASFLTVAWAAMVVYILIAVKKYKPDDHSLSMLEYLSLYLIYLKKERKLVGTVSYWYVLPFALFTLLFFIGFPGTASALLVKVFVVAGVSIFVIVLNQRALRKDFDPLITRLETGIKDLQNEEADNQN
jgi:hypothetical protein